MVGDAREETLREVASLGNYKAVQHFIHAGVNMGIPFPLLVARTALHWASQRNHPDIVRLLLSNGGDPQLKTKKGQTALHLGQKYEETRAILEAYDALDESVEPEPELPFVPVYLKNPDLEKSWLHPDEFQEKVSMTPDRPAVSIDTAELDTSPPPTTVDSHTKEIVVYLSARKDDCILGSVFIKNEPIERAICQIKEELDLPSEYSIARHNGKIQIPINSKQLGKNLLDIFRGDDDVLVVTPT